MNRKCRFSIYLLVVIYIRSTFHKFVIGLVKGLVFERITFNLIMAVSIKQCCVLVPIGDFVYNLIQGKDWQIDHACIRIYFLCEIGKRRQMKALIMGRNLLLVFWFMQFRVWISKRFPQITILKSYY